MTRFAAPIGALILAAVLFAAPLFASVSVVEDEVIFTFGGLSAGAVFLVGDFNGWNPTMDLMVPKDDGFEVRLYLVAGSYRYRFIVDGVSKADPDNPCVDDEGNSCFALVEKDGTLEIVFAESRGAPGASAKSTMAPSLRMRGYASEGGGFLFSEGSVKGTIDENVDADLSVGCTHELVEDEPFKGTSFLVRCLAAYRSERGTLRAFSRLASAIEPRDPLELFGSVGPYRYPVGLFCRGLSFEGRLPFGVDAWLLYASRISGYRSGLEGVASSSDVFSKRDPVDSDMIGMRLGAKVGMVEARYVYRNDRRPKEGLWRYPGFGAGLYRGFERAEFHGVGLSLPAVGQALLEGEFLFGRNFLEATGQSVGNTQNVRDISLEGKWENGQRIYFGISRAGRRMQSKLSYTRTTLEGDRELRGGRPDGSRVSIDGACFYGQTPFSAGLEGAIEQYSASNPGSVFWIGRKNFWLDGDELSYDRIPFLSSRRIYNIRLTCAWKYEPLGELPWGKGLKFSIVQRGDPVNEKPLFREAVLSNGVPVHTRVTLFIDMRVVSYRYERIKRDFVDVFLSAHGSITSSLWCACGVGVNPYGFDRWLYAFSDHGRADYIAEQGIFSDLAAYGEEASVKKLVGAEQDLSEDWIVTFEAGFTF